MTSAEISAWNEAKDDASARVKLSPEETKAVERYVGGDVYEWSAIQRGVPGFEMTEFFEFWIDLAQKAIAKFDPFVGRTYRNVGFRNVEKFRVFLAEHSEGAAVPLSAFTSASKDPNGYVVTLPFVAHLVIDGHTGRDISESFAYPWQREVIHLPGATIHVNKVLTANDGRPLIFATEVAGNGKELRTDLRGVGQDSPRAVDEGRRGTDQGNRARSVYEGVHSDRRKEVGGSSVAALSDLNSQYSLADDLTPEKRKAFIETFDAEFGAGATEQMFKAHDQMARVLTSSIRCGRMVQEGLTCGYRFHSLSSAI